MTSPLIPYLDNPLTDLFKDQLKDKILNQIFSYRTNIYFESLWNELQTEKTTGKETEQVNLLLDKIVKSKNGPDMIFETYRKVAFGASKNIGPRMIGILLAPILKEERISTEDEDLIFSVAEELTDTELLGFTKHFEKTKQLHSDDFNDGIPVPFYRENLEQTVGRSFFRPNINLAKKKLGSFVGKLANIGILLEDIIENEQPQADPLTGIPGASGTIAIEYSLMIDPKHQRIVDLINRAIGPTTKGTGEAL